MSIPVLESYVAGSWRSPSDEGPLLLDAATGEPVARISARGVDAPQALRHAREIGGPALRELTFPQRAALLKEVALHALAGKDELYRLSRRTGALDSDSAVDIDGGIGTLLAYASRAKRDLPDGRVLIDGDTEALGKGGTFRARHLRTPLRGVSVQINAFNFPVWGFLEKLAPAFLAGVPTIVKPASQTAHLTEALVRQIIESGILPEGCVQFVAGSAGGLLDGLTGQDSVYFTGSADTASTLRQHPAVVDRSVRFNAEADSLNCSVLGPEVTVGEPEFGLFVEQLVTEMTVKAGQKCTAIRRAMVPEALLDDVTDAVRARLDAVVVGAPTVPEATMGALASRHQRDDVAAAIAELRQDCDLVAGDPERPRVVGADPAHGAFLPPLLLRCDDRTASRPHEVEAFGPVSTLLPYRSVAEAVDMAVRGRGSLVASIVTHDRDAVREFVLGAAHSHGRILVLDRDDAAESTGHGIPMPMLVHGGPGRAGGGEELGGMRSVLRHMQRTAVQGSPTALAAAGLVD